LSFNNHDGKYQNLLGVTGFLEEAYQQEQELVMINKKSETKEVNVTEVTEHHNPKTGDSVSICASIEIISVAGIIYSQILRKKKTQI
jgi:hypothetical protein